MTFRSQHWRIPETLLARTVTMVSELCADKLEEIGGDLGGDEGQSRPVVRDLDDDHFNPRR